MLSSCLTPQYNVRSFVVLQRPSYLIVPVTVTTHWYDNYGLAILQQLQDLMRSWWFVGLLILGIAALISAITSVTVAAISLTQQVHTAQYVDTMSKNVFLTLATQEARNEDRCPRKSNNTYWDWITDIKSRIGTVLSCRLPVDMCNTPEGKRDRL